MLSPYKVAAADFWPAGSVNLSSGLGSYLKQRICKVITSSWKKYRPGSTMHLKMLIGCASKDAHFPDPDPTFIFFLKITNVPQFHPPNCRLEWGPSHQSSPLWMSSCGAWKNVHNELFILLRSVNYSQKLSLLNSEGIHRHLTETNLIMSTFTFAMDNFDNYKTVVTHLYN